MQQVILYNLLLLFFFSVLLNKMLFLWVYCTMKQTLGEQTPIRLNVVIGVTLILGTIGGLYYITKRTNLLSQILERKPKRVVRDLCNVCFATLDRENLKICTACCNCKKYICRGQNCSIWIPNQAQWECRLCYLSNESRSRTSEWINHQDYIPHKFFHSMRNIRSGFSTPVRDYDGDLHLFNNLETHRSSPQLFHLDERENIRRHVENTISKMLGGSLDEVSVGQLYENKEYLPQCEQNAKNEYAGVSNIKLKKLIERIIEETINLPSLLSTDHNNRGISNRHNENLSYFDPKKYQELLATAVLNKIVDTYNYEKNFEDNISEAQFKTASFNKNYNANTDKNMKSCSRSSSSIEPHSDCSLTDPANNISRCHDISPSDSCSNICADNINQNITDDDESTLNDYLRAHKVPLPALSISSESADDEFVSVATSNGQEGTWEDNWLFKRKKLGADTSVGMLVPAPKEDIKALIGDKTADEMSDLSEAGSDYEDVNNNMDDLKPANVRIHNQNVISGKNNIGLFDELIEQTSLISTSSLLENEPIFTETKNEFVLGNDGFNDVENPKLNLNTGNISAVENEAVNVNVDSNISKTETKKILHQTSVGSFEEPIIAPPNGFTDKILAPSQTTFLEGNKLNNSLDSVASDSSNAGSIAERERKKWLNAVEMPNNPYSPEALKRRLSDGPERHIDIPNINPIIERTTNEEPLISPPGSANKSLDVGLNVDKEPDYKRYSRDYYINNDQNLQNNSNSIIKRNTTTTSENQNERIVNSKIEEIATTQSNCFDDDKLSQNSDIYSAKIVHIEEYDQTGNNNTTSDIQTGNDIITSKEQLINKNNNNNLSLSGNSNNFGNESENLNSPTILTTTTASASSSLFNEQNSSQNSLTPSEDSDTIRIYDLNKQETRIIKDEQITTTDTKSKLLSSVPSSSSDKTTRPKILSITTKLLPQKKILTPAALKFLQPKRRIFEPEQIMSDTEGTSSPVFERRDITPTTSTMNKVPEKNVIEPEVAQALPSVKALARAFLLTSAKCASKHPEHPKIRNSTSENELNNEKTKPSPDSYSPPYQQITYSPIGPITPSPQQEEVEQQQEQPNDSSNETFEENQMDNENVENNNSNDEDVSVERPISPVLEPGKLKNNIAFFENLKRN